MMNGLVICASGPGKLSRKERWGSGVYLMSIVVVATLRLTDRENVMRNIPETINVVLWTHDKSGLMVAMSPDIPGLYVHGQSEDEINSRIPVALRALVDADQQLASKRVKGLTPPEGFHLKGEYQLGLQAA